MAVIFEEVQNSSETLTGTGEDDTIILGLPGRGTNVILAGAGDDQIAGLGASPTIIQSGSGSDILSFSTDTTSQETDITVADRLVIAEDFTSLDKIQFRDDLGFDRQIRQGEVADLIEPSLRGDIAVIGLQDPNDTNVILLEFNGDGRWDAGITLRMELSMSSASVGDLLIQRNPERPDFFWITLKTGAGLNDEQAQTVALLFEAGLNRDGNLNASGINFWIDRREEGLSEADLAMRFLESDEFRIGFGEALDATASDYLSNRDLTSVLFQNVLNRDGLEAGIDFWTNQLDDGLSRDELLLAFAKSPENVSGSPLVASLYEAEPGLWDFA